MYVKVLPQYMVLILINDKDYDFQTIFKQSITTTLVKGPWGIFYPKPFLFTQPLEFIQIPPSDTYEGEKEKKGLEETGSFLHCTPLGLRFLRPPKS